MTAGKVLQNSGEPRQNGRGKQRLLVLFEKVSERGDNEPRDLLLRRNFEELRVKDDDVVFAKASVVSSDVKSASRAS